MTGPNEDNPALVVRQQRGYKPRQEWLEARFQEFTSIAQALDG